MVKVANLIGAQRVMTIGSQAVAHKDIIVQSIIQGDSQADVLSLLYSPLYISMHTSRQAQS